MTAPPLSVIAAIESFRSAGDAAFQDIVLFGPRHDFGVGPEWVGLLIGGWVSYYRIVRQRGLDYPRRFT